MIPGHFSSIFSPLGAPWLFLMPSITDAPLFKTKTSEWLIFVKDVHGDSRHCLHSTCDHDILNLDFFLKEKIVGRKGGGNVLLTPDITACAAK